MVSFLFLMRSFLIILFKLLTWFPSTASSVFSHINYYFLIYCIIYSFAVPVVIVCLAPLKSKFHEDELLFCSWVFPVLPNFKRKKAIALFKVMAEWQKKRIIIWKKLEFSDWRVGKWKINVAHMQHFNSANFMEVSELYPLILWINK